MINVWIDKIEFNDGTRVSFEPGEIVVFVGPNNSGKSATLKESFEFLKSKQKGSQTSRIIKDFSFSREGNEEDFFEYMKLNSSQRFQDQPEPWFSNLGYNIYKPHLVGFWTNEDGLGGGISIFAKLLGTEQRLQVANPPSNINLTNDTPQHPIHSLQIDDRLEEKFNEYFNQAFGIDLVVNRGAGSIVPLHVGKKPIPKTESGEDRASFSYLTQINSLDHLHSQGDGMRSFVGVLLTVFVSNQKILFIDEPEAFLHPPQAKLLGKMLAQDLVEDTQIFLATHSEDFLKGILDSNRQKLKIIRIQRDGSKNNICVIHDEDIRSIWKDPILRHSNILDGIFHSSVILCEGDADCRFYSSILNSLFEGTTANVPDVHFIHCGGKHRMPVVIQALRKLNVPIKAICDFDVLNNISPLKEIYESFGGEWSEIQGDFDVIKAKVDQKKPELLSHEVKRDIQRILDSITEDKFPSAKAIEINKTLKRSSPWATAKSGGKGFIPAGDATRAFQSLNKRLIEKGFFILEMGELESFCRSVGNHGPKWVNEVLTKDLLNDPELEEARKFVRQLVEN